MGDRIRRRRAAPWALAAVLIMALSAHADGKRASDAGDLSVPEAGEKATQKTGEEKDRSGVIQRPSWGKVIGWVLDASTREPVPGARVSVEVDGAFPEGGKSTDATDKGGRFEAKAPLGKISSKFDWGRLLTMHPVSLILSPRSVTKQTKILDVVQANVRVEADGYKPFVGRVRASRLNAGDFSITLDDVWLAPKDARLASFSPERLRLETVEDLTVEPAIAAPDEKVTLRLTARLPVDRGYRYRAYATSTAIRLVANDTELKREKGEKDSPRMVFSKTGRLPKHPLDGYTELGFYLVRDGATTLRQRDTKALLQIVRNADERPVAEKVAEGYARARAGDREEALRSYAEARKLKPDYALAHILYGDLCMQLNRPRDAAGAYKQLVDLDPHDYQVARSRYALTLLQSGNPGEALTTLAGAEEATGKKRVPAEVALVRARAYAAQGNFDEADKWLAKAGTEVQIPEETLTEINSKRMEAAVKTSPGNSDLRLSYARVLYGARRREEAVSQIRKAVELDPAQPWAYIDLGTTLWALGERDEGLADLEHARKLAPNNPEALLALGDAYRDMQRYGDALALYRKVAEAQRLNLRARHNMALMLYVTGKLDEARKEFLEVAAQARDKGDLKEEGLLIPGASIYIGPKRRLVYGFSIPEATADVTILEALQDLDIHPRSGLLWQNIGGALLDLNLPALALPALARSEEYDPSLLETRFLTGLAYRRLGRREEARRELQTVVSENPLHPRARLELAQLYTDEGNLEQAQAQILAHAKNYPYERPARQTQSFGG